MKDELHKLDWEVVEKVASMKSDTQYAILFDALKQLVEEEPNREILAMLATQLYELSEAALKRSGYQVTQPLSKSVN